MTGFKCNVYWHTKPNGGGVDNFEKDWWVAPWVQSAGRGPVTLPKYRILLVKLNIEQFEKGRWECGGRPMGGALGPRAAPGGGTLGIPAAYNN